MSDIQKTDDAKKMLFEHYSSKSSNQTSILLGLAVASLTLIQSYNVIPIPMKGQYIILAIGMEFIAFLILRAIGRLIIWGGKASAIVVMPDINDRLKENETILSRVDGWCWQSFKGKVKSSKISNTVFRSTDSPCYKWACGIIIFLTPIILLAIP